VFSDSRRGIEIQYAQSCFSYEDLMTLFAIVVSFFRFHCLFQHVTVDEKVYFIYHRVVAYIVMTYRLVAIESLCWLRRLCC